MEKLQLMGFWIRRMSRRLMCLIIVVRAGVPSIASAGTPQNSTMDAAHHEQNFSTPFCLPQPLEADGSEGRLVRLRHGRINVLRGPTAAYDTLWPRDLGAVAAAMMMDTTVMAVVGPTPEDTVFFRSLYVAIDPALSAAAIERNVDLVSGRILGEVRRGFLLVQLPDVVSLDDARSIVRRMTSMHGVRGVMLMTARERAMRFGAKTVDERQAGARATTARVLQML